MEDDIMVVSDDGLTTRTTLKKKQPSATVRNKCRFRLIPLGIGCAALALLVVLGSVTIFKTVPNRDKPTAFMEKKADDQSIFLKALFSTDYKPSDETESISFTNINGLTDQLNAKLNGEQIRITGAFFREQVLLDGLVCEDLLSGMALQLNIAAFYSPQCNGQSENICKLQFQKQLKNKLARLLSKPITIQFDENNSKTVTLKICSLTELTEEDTRKVVEKQANVPAKWRRRKLGTSTMPAVAQPVRDSPIDPVNYVVQNSLLQSSSCSLNIGSITLVQMAGEFGSRIQDDTRVDTVITNDLYTRYRTVTVYENLVYQLQVQLNCNGQIGRDSTQNACESAQEIHAWIDFNNNDYDDRESRILRRTDSNGRLLGNMYDLEVYIPIVDERNILSGPHRMRLTVIPSEDYRRNCGDSNYKETRDYTVIIAPKAKYRVETSPANIVYDNRICSMNSGKIALVLMAGQKGTEIRDDKPTSTALSDYRNQHHLGVTLYDSTVYLIRIQLDCNWQLDQELFEKGCNLAQDVNIWIDLNNDGRYDESEIGAPYRWPVTSYLPEGIYDLQIRVPSIDSQYIRSGRHRMRLVVMSNDHYHRVCGRIDYNETREYFVNVISKTDHSVVDETTPINPLLLRNIVCSSNVGSILLIVMPGEHRTQIRDDPSERELWNNAYHQRHPIVLYQDHIYLLRIQLDCSRQWNDQSTEHNCQLIYDVNAWIDLNDDGVFDQSENVAPYRWPLNSYTPKGVYDLQIYTPIIDNRVTKYGPHKMQVEVKMSEYYRQKCGDNNYKEVRNYNVYVVPYRTQAVDVGVPYVPLSDGVCTQLNGKIVLVIMAGEQGTQIRDNIPTNIVLRESQNRHHLAVTLYESTTYRLRVQLSCRQQTDGTWSDINCNLAQDVNVLIDFNNDGTYSEVESRIVRRWPLHSDIPLGIYDFEIDLPGIDEQITRTGSHRMRIVVTSSDEYRRKCGNNNNNHYEEREYTVNIIPRTENIIPRTVNREFSRGVSFCLPGSLVCASGNNGIAFVELSGEQNTIIRDEATQCSATNNYDDRSNLVVNLFENTAYTLNTRLYCVQDRDYSNSYNRGSFLGSSGCNYSPYFGVWIDFNDDGSFDQNTERVLFDNSYPNDERSSEYQLRIVIPELGGGYYRNKPHRMRVLLTTNEQNVQPCYSTGSGEARDYSVQISSRSGY